VPLKLMLRNKTKGIQTLSLLVITILLVAISTTQLSSMKLSTGNVGEQEINNNVSIDQKLNQYHI
jgi:hypothetical protein